MCKYSQIIECLQGGPIHVSKLSKKTDCSLKEIKDELKRKGKKFLIANGKISLIESTEAK